MKAFIIVNPHAHSDMSVQQVQGQRDEISARLTEGLKLEKVEWSETKRPNHGRVLAQQAVRDDYDFIFAGGGDGTINEVLNGIMSVKRDAAKMPVLGVLPFGTSNDFYAGLRAAEAARPAEQQGDVTMPLDVGHVQFDHVERYFCLTIGIGLSSWANLQYLELSRTFGRRFAHIPAAIAAVISYRFFSSVHITRDGVRSRARRLLTVMINNSPIISGGIHLSPDAKMNDGQFDVVVVKAVSLLALAKLVLQVGMGTHAQSQSIEMSTVQKFTLTSRQALPIHVDGELVPEIDSKARRMEVEIMPSALRVVIPSLCSLEKAPVVETQIDVPAS